MPDLVDIPISCSNPKEMFAAYNRIITGLPADLRRQFGSVLRGYMAAYGFDGACERFNGRTVSQLIEEFRDPDGLPVVETGEMDGVKYTLYEAPRPGEGRA